MDKNDWRRVHERDQKMVNTDYDEVFKKKYKKLNNKDLKLRIIKQTDKIIENPRIGKPIMFNRKSTREVYVHPFRIPYQYVEEEKLIVFLNIYHKDAQ